MNLLEDIQVQGWRMSDSSLVKFMREIKLRQWSGWRCFTDFDSLIGNRNSHVEKINGEWFIVDD